MRRNISLLNAIFGKSVNLFAASTDLRCEINNKPATMKRLHVLTTPVTALFVLGFLVLNSCKKSEPTIAEIQVVTATGTSVAGAEVNLYAESTQTGDTTANDYRFPEEGFTEYTDGTGVARFDFSSWYEAGQSGFAILNVSVTKEYPDSIGEAEGVIKIVEEETTRRTFILR